MTLTLPLLKGRADAALVAMREGNAAEATALADALAMDALPLLRDAAETAEARVAAAETARTAAVARFAQRRSAAAAAAWLSAQGAAEEARLLAAIGRGSGGGSDDDVDAAVAAAAEAQALEARICELKKRHTAAKEAVARHQQQLQQLQTKGAEPLAEVSRLRAVLPNEEAEEDKEEEEEVPLEAEAANKLPDALFVLFHVIASWGGASSISVRCKGCNDDNEDEVAVEFAPDDELAIVRFVVLGGTLGGVVAVRESRSPPVLAELVEGDDGLSMPTLRARYSALLNPPMPQQHQQREQRTYHWAQWLAGVPGDQQLQPPTAPAASANELLDRIKQHLLHSQ